MSAFLLASFVIFFSQYHWFENLSLWKNLGWESAPSIGLTRAYWLLLHGDVQAAWERNWLIFPVLLILAMIFMRDLYKRVRGE
ncbi:MAG: DUF2752 domain-containing protein [Candidatus Saccharibacteria bacterium]|nr:DUF2752 domain-containing protein [Candidatus Saccharibacteria bacterium]